METEALEIRHFPIKGRGVVSKRRFEPGDVIEVCPVIVLPITEKPSWLMSHVFHWNGRFAIALGYGSLYNHSPEPNADWDSDEQALIITFSAIRRIEAGEEVCFDYNGSEEVLRREFGIGAAPL